MPELNPIAMITKMSGSSTPLMGWMGHFVIGTVLWGLLYVQLLAFIGGRARIYHRFLLKLDDRN